MIVPGLSNDTIMDYFKGLPELDWDTILTTYTTRLNTLEADLIPIAELIHNGSVTLNNLRYNQLSEQSINLLKSRNAGYHMDVWVVSSPDESKDVSVFPFEQRDSEYCQYVGRSDDGYIYRLECNSKIIRDILRIKFLRRREMCYSASILVQKRNTGTTLEDLLNISRRMPLIISIGDIYNECSRRGRELKELMNDPLFEICSDVVDRSRLISRRNNGLSCLDMSMKRELVGLEEKDVDRAMSLCFKIYIIRLGII